MKSKKSIFVCVMTGLLVLSASSSVCGEAVAGVAGIKKCVILDAPSWWNINDYNTNNDNTVNVLDLCRAKQHLLKQNETITFGLANPSVSLDKSTVTVPVYVKGNTSGVYSIQFSVDYDREYFQFFNVYTFELGGSAAYSPDMGIVQYMAGSNQNVTKEGNIVYLTFKTKQDIPHGTYEFKLNSIEATRLDASSEAVQIPENECPGTSETLIFDFFREPEVTVTTVTTTVTTTEPPVYTTVTEPTTTTHLPVSDKLRFSLENGEVTSDGSKLKIPVYMHSNSSGISTVSMNIEYDESMFSIAGVSGGQYGGFGYSAGNNNLVFMMQNAQNITDSEGIIAYIEFNIQNRDKSGTYSFRLRDIKPTYSENWNQQQISGDQYVGETDIYSFDYRGNVNTTVTTSTTPVITTTPITTTTLPETTTVTIQTTPGSSDSITEEKLWLISKINEVRVQNNLQPLLLSEDCCRASDIRAQQLSVRYDEDQPDGTDYKELLYDNNVFPFRISQYLDNACKDKESVYADYMSAAGAYVSDSRFKELGIGHYISGSSHYWVIYIYS